MRPTNSSSHGDWKPRISARAARAALASALWAAIAGCGDTAPRSAADGGAGANADATAGGQTASHGDGSAGGTDARTSVGDGRTTGAADGTRSDARASRSCIAPAALPAATSSDPPTAGSTCTYMDWRLSPDGFYLISKFGMDTDQTTWGRGTSCGGLISHYTTWCCQYDRHKKKCIDGGTPRFLQCKRSDPRVPKPPWVKGTVDYHTATAMSRVRGYYFDAHHKLKPYDATKPFRWPEYFYVAGAQRFNCGSLLRVTNTENGRCIVVYVEDGGPGSRYEQAGYGSRRILDASPALHAYLEPKHAGWKSSTLLYIEWGKPGDRPGMPCAPCQSTPAKRGTEKKRTSYDINHYDAANCRAKVGP